MRGNRGRIWLAVVSLALCLLCAPSSGMAVETLATGGYPAFTLAAAQTPLEPQMLGGAPFHSHPPPKDADALCSSLGFRLQSGRDGGAAIKLPHILQLQI